MATAMGTEAQAGALEAVETEESMEAKVDVAMAMVVGRLARVPSAVDLVALGANMEEVKGKVVAAVGGGWVVEVAQPATGPRDLVARLEEVVATEVVEKGVATVSAEVEAAGRLGVPAPRVEKRGVANSEALAVCMVQALVVWVMAVAAAVRVMVVGAARTTVASMAMAAAVA